MDVECVKRWREGETEDRTEQRVREEHWCQEREKKAALEGEKSIVAALNHQTQRMNRLSHQLCRVHTSRRCYRRSVVSGHDSAVLFPLRRLLCRLHFDLWRFGVGWQVVGGLQQLEYRRK